MYEPKINMRYERRKRKSIALDGSIRFYEHMALQLWTDDAGWVDVPVIELEYKDDDDVPLGYRETR